jgi:hypothetical protein
MSWDVFIQHMPASAVRVADIPEGFEPLPLGGRREVMEAIAGVFPMVRASDPTWFVIDEPRYRIEIAVVGEDPVDTITLHIRGDASVIPHVHRLIETLGARAIDSWTGEFFDPETAAESVQRWQDYVDPA